MGPVQDATDPIPLVDFKAEHAAHGAEISAAINDVVRSSQFIMGPAVAQLEQKLSDYVSIPVDAVGHTEDHVANGDTIQPVHCIAVSDGTAALQLCLMALKIGVGHEVVTTPFTWISSAEVIPLLGATPVFVDVEPDSCLIDPNSLRRALTPLTRAVIAVSLYGLIPDMRAIRTILDEAERKFNTRIALIEDGAQSFGAVRFGARSCALGCVTMGTTSFFPTKPLACYGDGGAVFTRDGRLADLVRALRVHGKVKGEHVCIGLNSRLDTLQAAVLLAKLPLFDDMLQARRRAAEVYMELLAGEGRVVLPGAALRRVREEDGSVQSAWGVFTVRVKERDAVLKTLKAAGIGCGVYYEKGVHRQPVFKGMVDVVTEGRCEVVDRLCGSVLALPMHAYLMREVQVRVVRELTTALDDLGVTERPE